MDWRWKQSSSATHFEETVGAIVDGLALKGVTIGCSLEQAVVAIVERMALEKVTVGYSIKATVGAIVEDWRWKESPSAATLNRQ